MTTTSEVGQTYWTGPIENPKLFRLDGVKGSLLEFARGGEGAVFRATRNESIEGEIVALKLLANVSVEEYERISTRCLAIGEVHHTNIMRQEETFIGAAFWSDEPPKIEDFEIVFCVAEWIEGQSLLEVVVDATIRQKLTWACQIARAVQYLHDFRSSRAPNGLIHRDIKPSNIRIESNGQAILIDFGMSRPNCDSDLTGGAGTFLWMAPESIGDSPTTGPHSDVWGVGAIAHWLITGIPPRLDDSTSIRRDRIKSKCRELGAIGAHSMARLIASPLEGSPRNRPKDLVQWARTVERISNKGDRRRQFLKSVRTFVSRPSGVVVLLASLLTLSAGAWASAVQYSHHEAEISKENALVLAKYHKYKLVIPGSSAGSVSEYVGPSSRDRVVGSLTDGATIYIKCQIAGSEVGYPEYTIVWDLLNTGYYVSDFYTNTPTPYNFSGNIARCPK